MFHRANQIHSSINIQASAINFPHFSLAMCLCLRLISCARVARVETKFEADVVRIFDTPDMQVCQDL